MVCRQDKILQGLETKLLVGVKNPIAQSVERQGWKLASLLYVLPRSRGFRSDPSDGVLGCTPNQRIFFSISLKLSIFGVL